MSNGVIPLRQEITADTFSKEPGWCLVRADIGGPCWFIGRAEEAEGSEGSGGLIAEAMRLNPCVETGVSQQGQNFVRGAGPIFLLGVKGAWDLRGVRMVRWMSEMEGWERDVMFELFKMACQKADATRAATSGLALAPANAKLPPLRQ